ncbi:hypothetical protein JTE90_018732 [Oedothorax gibbosus]|uniref:Uncharacterized protein n=1 Tax=Oedothorax gibbosus TaxID=931172 RepID=A0AAV6UIW8_9ARAC|nr:hypothetical protein JTE90_018732 [Oedothorax gibbosus]
MGREGAGPALRRRRDLCGKNGTRILTPVDRADVVAAASSATVYLTYGFPMVPSFFPDAAPLSFSVERILAPDFGRRPAEKGPSAEVKEDLMPEEDSCPASESSGDPWPVWVYCSRYSARPSSGESQLFPFLPALYPFNPIGLSSPQKLPTKSGLGPRCMSRRVESPLQTQHASTV